MKLIGVITRLALIALSVVSMHAATIYGTAADLTGTRTEGSGLVTVDGWANDQLIQSVSWNIVDNGNGTWTYSYSFSNFSSPAISHFVLDLTDDCVDPGDPGCVVGLTGSPGSYDANDPSNPNFPANAVIVGIKFDFGAGTYTFTSNREPVWGDIYLKGGSGPAAYNSGLADRETIDPLAFVARPDGGGGGGQDVPEPSTLGLALAGIGLLVAGKTRIRRSR